MKNSPYFLITLVCIEAQPIESGPRNAHPRVLVHNT